MSIAISAIIVNYNAGTFLRKSVAYFLNCPLEIEIIVVDNASIDDSLNSLVGLPSIQIINLNSV